MVSPKGSVEDTRDAARQDLSLSARPHMSIGPWLWRPPESSRASAARPGTRHGELPGSILSHPAPRLDPRRVVLSDVGIGSCKLHTSEARRALTGKSGNQEKIQWESSRKGKDK